MGYKLSGGGGGRSPGKRIKAEPKARPAARSSTKVGEKKKTRRGTLLKVKVDVPSTVRGVHDAQVRVKMRFGELVAEETADFYRRHLETAADQPRPFTQSMRARYDSAVMIRRTPSAVTLSLDTRDAVVRMLDVGYPRRHWWDILEHARRLRVSKAGKKFVDIPTVYLESGARRLDSRTLKLVRHARILSPVMQRYFKTSEPGKRMVPLDSRGRSADVDMAARRAMKHGRPEFMESAYPKRLKHGVTFIRVVEDSSIAQRMIEGWRGIRLLSAYKKSKRQIVAAARQRLQQEYKG